MVAILKPIYVKKENKIYVNIRCTLILCPRKGVSLVPSSLKGGIAFAGDIVGSGSDGWSCTDEAVPLQTERRDEGDDEDYCVAEERKFVLNELRGFH